MSPVQGSFLERRERRRTTKRNPSRGREYIYISRGYWLTAHPYMQLGRDLLNIHQQMTYNQKYEVLSTAGLCEREFCFNDIIPCPPLLEILSY